MPFYVRTTRTFNINHRIELAKWILGAGISDVSYFSGGWDDDYPTMIYPHLKFEREDDAIVYVLVHGGLYEKEVPCAYE